MDFRNNPEPGPRGGQRALYFLFGLLAVILTTLIFFRVTGIFDEHRTFARIVILTELAVFVGLYLYLRLKVWGGSN